MSGLTADGSTGSDMSLPKRRQRCTGHRAVARRSGLLVNALVLRYVYREAAGKRFAERTPTAKRWEIDGTTEANFGMDQPPIRSPAGRCLAAVVFAHGLVLAGCALTIAAP
jgi:hypothetical protein